MSVLRWDESLDEGASKVGVVSMDLKVSDGWLIYVDEWMKLKVVG